MLGDEKSAWPVIISHPAGAPSSMALQGRGQMVHLAGGQVDLLLVAAAHGGPQLALQRLCGRLQLPQQAGRDCDVIAPAPLRPSFSRLRMSA